MGAVDRKSGKDGVAALLDSQRSCAAGAAQVRLRRLRCAGPILGVFEMRERDGDGKRRRGERKHPNVTPQTSGDLDAQPLIKAYAIKNKLTS
jgi:hypothetical protein